MGRILTIDSDRERVALLTSALEKYGFDLLSVSDTSKALSFLECSPAPSLIILGAQKTCSDGLRTLKILKTESATANIPVIMVSDDDSEMSIITAIDMGAHDCVNSCVAPPVLAARIRSALRLSQAHVELEKTNVLLCELATRDSLTNFYNRRQFLGLATREIAKSTRSSTPLAFMMIDIDHFKRINDHYGHPAGDSAIKRLAVCCSETSRATDIIGRIGGEEFAVCCPNTDWEGAVSLAERLRCACEDVEIHSADTESFSMTISIGVVIAEPGEMLDDVLKRVDILLYKAKKLGRNRVVWDNTVSRRDFTIKNN